MRPIIPTKKRNSGGKMFFVFALLLLIFLSINQGSFRAASLWLNMAAVPFWNIADSITNALPSSDSIFRSKAALATENENLRQKINALTRDLKGYDFIIQENLELKKLFSGKKDGGIFAGVIARPGGLPFDIFLLDAGSTSGIENGDLVLADQNIALGKTIETNPYSSKIRSFSSAGETTDVLLGPENIPVKLSGAGAGEYIAELPRDLDVKEGDAAVLPGAEGFILGYVESKEENLTDSFQKLYLRSPINVFELKYVQVIQSVSLRNEHEQ